MERAEKLETEITLLRKGNLERVDKKFYRCGISGHISTNCIEENKLLNYGLMDALVKILELVKNRETEFATSYEGNREEDQKKV